MLLSNRGQRQWSDFTNKDLEQDLTSQTTRNLRELDHTTETCDGAHTTLGLEVSCHKVTSASDVEAGFVKFLRRKSTVKSKDVIVKHPVPALTRLGYQHFKLYPVTTSDGSDKSYSPFVMSSNAFFT